MVATAVLGGACHAALDLPPPPDLASPDFAGPPDFTPAPIAINLLGDWQFSADAQVTTDPSAVVLTNNESWISVMFSGIAGGCGCSSRHLVVTMPHDMPCNTTAMTFDWTTDQADFTATRSTALRIVFGANGSNNGTQGHFVASTWAGQSNCAVDNGNFFPAPPHLANGHNQFVLHDLDNATTGGCSADQSFTTIDIHIQGYTCGGSLTALLSNLVFYE